MADTVITAPFDGGFRQRYVDMGDGTKAAVVVAMDRNIVAGGASTYRAVSAASANAAVLKSSAGILYGIQITNMAALAASRTVKLYNQSTVPIASDLPAMVIVMPGNSIIDISRSRGVAFPLGLAIAITTGPLDGVFAAIGAGDVTVNVNFT